MVGDIHACREESEEERAERLEFLAHWERQAAYEAVAVALAKHRWWGWGSITRSIRMWITGVKFRLGMKLWP